MCPNQIFSLFFFVHDAVGALRENNAEIVENAVVLTVQAEDRTELFQNQTNFRKPGSEGRHCGQRVLHVRRGNGARRVLEVRPLLPAIGLAAAIAICCEKTN